jgi:hypothetical protein
VSLAVHAADSIRRRQAASVTSSVSVTNSVAEGIVDPSRRRAPRLSRRVERFSLVKRSRLAL